MSFAPVFHGKKCVEAKLASAASIEVREERKEELEDLQQQMDELEEEIKEESQARADERFKEIELPTGLEVVEEIKEWLERWGHSHWRNSIDSVAENLIPEEQRAASADRAPDAPRA